MAVTTFIPELWSARLLHALDKTHVATAFVNRNYEGEIKQMGDRVHINSIGQISIKTYVKANGIADPDGLDLDKQTLIIDQAKYFNFSIKDVDAVQAAGDMMDAAMGRAAYGLADTSDAFIFSTMENADDINEVEEGASAYESCVNLAKALDKANVSKIGRKLAVNPDMYAELLLDSRFAGNGNASQEFAFNGYVGRVAGFDVYETNNLTCKALAEGGEATSFAEQLTEMEAYRPQNDFADAVKGLHVYGAKVTDPTTIAKLVPAKPAPTPTENA